MGEKGEGVSEINQCVFLRLSVLFFGPVCCSVCCFTFPVGILIFPVGIFKEEP